jgi:hypothetical protein
MTLFSAATAAALDAPPNSNASAFYCYNTCIEFPVKQSLSNAPNILHKLLLALVGSQPDILFYNASGEKIDVKDFLKEQAQFDAIFNTIITKERNQQLVVGFEIRFSLNTASS